MDKQLSAETLRTLLKYDSNTGLLQWLPRRPEMFNSSRNESLCKTWNNRFAGTYVTKNKSDDYIRTAIFGKRYKAHRLAWLHYYGHWPTDYIDHINGIKDDNRIFNLRDVNRQTNSKNQKTRNTNTSCFNGVAYEKETHKWRARITVDGKLKTIGRFAKKEDAVAARLIANKIHGYHDNHGRPA